jgi:prevent-host-death family protein
MSHVVNMHDAKATFSRLIELLESGEEVIIARAGRPVARLVPERSASTTRILTAPDIAALAAVSH